MWALLAAAAVRTIENRLEDLIHDAQFLAILTQLGAIQQAIRTGVQEILQEIQNLSEEVDDIFCATNMALANRAFSELVNGDNQQAQYDSGQAADTLYNTIPRTPSRSNVANIMIMGAFMYVLNIRLAVLKIDPEYYCNITYRTQFQGYITSLDGVIAYINNAIAAMHTVTVVTQTRGPQRPPGAEPDGGPQWRVMARYLRNGVVVNEFSSIWDEVPPTPAIVDSFRRRANGSRSSGISVDRQQLGVVDMENTVTSYRGAFADTLRTALVTQVLNRSMTPIDFHPDGFIVDGRILPTGRDLRATLMELLCSQDFRNRVQRSWDAFVNRGDDRLAQFAYHRLFDHDATPDEIALMRGIASRYGYTAFVTALLYCNEYEERHGNGVPSIGQPIIDALQGPPAQDVAGPPAQDVAGPPAQDVAGPPAQDVAGPPAQDVAGLHGVIRPRLPKLAMAPLQRS